MQATPRPEGLAFARRTRPNRPARSCEPAFQVDDSEHREEHERHYGYEPSLAQDEVPGQGDEGDGSVKTVPIAQGLRLRLREWERLLGTRHPVCRRIRHGAEIKLRHKLQTPQGLPRRRFTSLEDQQAMEKQLNEFLREGVIRPERRDQIQVVSPTYMLWRNRDAQGLPRKGRLIFNAKTSRLNPCVADAGRFTLPNFAALRAHFLALRYHTIIDVESAYCHIPVTGRAQRLLGIRGTGRDEYYVYTALPFGLRTSPYLYVSTMKAAVDAITKRHGIRVVWYMDDFCVSANDPETARHHSSLLIRELRHLGWRINEAKCKLDPSTRVEFLGFVWDSTKQECSLPGDKVTVLRHDLRRTARRLQQHLDEADNQGDRMQVQTVHMDVKIHIIMLQRLIGKLQAAQNAVCRLRELMRLPLRLLRNVLRASKRAGESNSGRVEDPKTSRSTWANAIFTMQLLAHHLGQWNGKSLLEKEVVLRSQSDASQTYCGAVALCVNSNGRRISTSASRRADMGAWRGRPPDVSPAPRQKQTPSDVAGTGGATRVDDQEIYDALRGDQRSQIEALARPRGLRTADARADPESARFDGQRALRLSWPVPRAIAHKHITRKETYAAVTSLIFWILHHDLHDGVLVTQVDNTATLAFLERAHGKNEELEQLAAPLHLLLAARDLEVRASYITSAKNEIADTLSRPGALAGAQLARRQVLHRIAERLKAPRPSVDLFATKASALCKRFASPLLGRGAIAQSAFQVDVGRETGSVYIFSAPRQMARVVTQILPRLPVAGGIVVAPYFPRQAWWRRLMQHTERMLILPAWAVEVPGLQSPSKTRWIAARVHSHPTGERSQSRKRAVAPPAQMRTKRQCRIVTTLYGPPTVDAELQSALTREWHRAQ